MEAKVVVSYSFPLKPSDATRTVRVQFSHAFDRCDEF